jgi:hypothetical protein
MVVTGWPCCGAHRPGMPSDTIHHPVCWPQPVREIRRPGSARRFRRCWKSAESGFSIAGRWGSPLCNRRERGRLPEGSSPLITRASRARGLGDEDRSPDSRPEPEHRQRLESFVQNCVLRYLGRARTSFPPCRQWPASAADRQRVLFTSIKVGIGESPAERFELDFVWAENALRGTA